MQVDKAEQIALVIWAADCAERVLKDFEEQCPGDDRPRVAIAAARAWTRGEVKVGSARKAALAAHSAARTTELVAARAAARSAGHAAATAHVATHSFAAGAYAVTSASAASGEVERDWQRARLPEHLWQIAFRDR